MKYLFMMNIHMKCINERIYISFTKNVKIISGRESIFILKKLIDACGIKGFITYNIQNINNRN